jgi:nucleoside-diphosphate-sugar epimerase
MRDPTLSFRVRGVNRIPLVTRRTALLTGGTGFLGRHVARALVNEGWTVRALSRRAGSAADLGFGDLPVSITAGDLAGADFEVAASGCDALVHLAGIVNARTLDAYCEVNARGTERLVRAAARSAPGALFLYVSSQAAVGPAREGRPVREGDEPRPVSWYGTSKLEGEEAVGKHWTGPWIVLRPGPIYGPGDRGLLVYFQLAESGWLPVPAASSKMQITHAAAIALAIARAASRPDLAGRKAFLCDPEPLTVGGLAAAVAGLRRPPARLIKLPDALVRIAGLSETLRESLTGRTRPFNADKAREILAGDWLCDPEPLRRDLDLPAPIPLSQGLRETRDWYIREGWLNL